MAKSGELGGKTQRSVRAAIDKARAKPPPPGLEAAPDAEVAKPSPREGAGLEKLVRSDLPALLVQNDTFARVDLPAWRAPLEEARPRLESAVRAAGRVEIEVGGAGEHLGTGWLVAQNLVVTNRHVAAAFALAKADGTFDSGRYPAAGARSFGCASTSKRSPGSTR